MAAVTPLPANKCVGTNADGTPNLQMYCRYGLDDQGNPIYTCATWKLFNAQCPSGNLACSNPSAAWVPAITVCNQNL